MNKPIKATSKESNAEPFYRIESNGDTQRYVVSIRDIMSIKSLLTGFINESNDPVQVKIRDLENSGAPADYSASMEKAKLLQLMEKHEAVIFHHGFHDLMVRNPESGDCLAFDEHGLIYIYSEADYAAVLCSLNVEFKPFDKLIYEFDHWHYALPEGQRKLLDFIGELGLEKE